MRDFKDEVNNEATLLLEYKDHGFQTGTIKQSE